MNTKWSVGGIEVDGLLEPNQPIYRIGESQTLVFAIKPGDDDPIGYGDAYGSAYGGTVTGKTLYEQLRQYHLYAGADSVTQLADGRLRVFEQDSENWPVESHIIKIEPVEDSEVQANPGMWALVTGGSDDTTFGGRPSFYRIGFEVTMLAFANDFDDREELLDALESPVNQLEGTV